MADSWKPTTLEELQEIVRQRIVEMPEELLPAFSKIRIPPHTMPLRRGNVWVIARHDNKVIFYDDIEDEFGVATVADKKLSNGSLFGELHHAVYSLLNVV